MISLSVINFKHYWVALKQNVKCGICAYHRLISLAANDAFFCVFLTVWILVLTVPVSRHCLHCTFGLTLGCSSRTSFQCSGDGSCIPSAWVCDGMEDCERGDDEWNCESTTEATELLRKK